VVVAFDTLAFEFASVSRGSCVMRILCLLSSLALLAFRCERTVAFSIRSLRPNKLSQKAAVSFRNAPLSPLRTSTTSSIAIDTTAKQLQDEIHPVKAKIVKAGMIAYIASMCVVLPLTLLPQRLLYKAKLLDKVKSERLALSTGQFCARWMLRLFPFCKVQASGPLDPDPQPSVWVCNHTSMLDVFLLMAADKKLRGKKKRPIKIVYWKQLEDNPVTRMLFRQAGFIPVQMTANAAGEDNDYDRSSFKKLLKDTKQAFEEGFDIGILPEGQLNPRPEEGLLPIFTGAFTLAKMSRRPINMMALHGTHKLWHPDDNIGMTVTGRKVQIRCYPTSLYFSSSDEFKKTFEQVVGTFGTHGQDLPDDELRLWLTGKALDQDKAAKGEESK